MVNFRERHYLKLRNGKSSKACANLWYKFWVYFRVMELTGQAAAASLRPDAMVAAQEKARPTVKGGGPISIG